MVKSKKTYLYPLFILLEEQTQQTEEDYDSLEVLADENNYEESSGKWADNVTSYVHICC